MASPDRKFLLAQYLDGTLPPRQRAQLERQLAQDPGAQQFLEEEMRLDSILGAAPAPPAVDWEELELRISAAVAATPHPLMRHRPPLAWVGAAVALAACVLVAFGISLLTRSAPAPQEQAIATEAAAVVIGPQAETAPGQPAIAEVVLASPANADDASTSDPNSADRPSRVFISSATVN
jgi:anti-sigma factor RsiW